MLNQTHRQDRFFVLGPVVLQRLYQNRVRPIQPTQLAPNGNKMDRFQEGFGNKMKTVHPEAELQFPTWPLSRLGLFLDMHATSEIPKVQLQGENGSAKG
jgi:hypothetical protein